jgi:hypothetical protein
MINGSTSLTKTQQRSSEATLTSCLDTMSCQSCATDAVAYHFGLKNAVSATRRQSWKGTHFDVRCVGYCLDLYRTGLPFRMIIYTFSDLAHL